MRSVLFAAGAFVALVIASTFLSSRGQVGEAIVEVVSGLALIGALAGLMIYTWIVARRHRMEMIQLEAIEELVTLRRWPQAAMVLEAMLSQPTRTQQARIQALIYLSGVLSRYERFDEAISVQNYLLDNVNMDDMTAHALRMGRTMAMLRQDHLFDADRAISDLRRRIGRQPTAEAAGDVLPQAPESAGLALIEIYRDVKTGHPTEALETFRARLPVLRRQLGHRVADGWALAAKAHDLLGQEVEAQAAFENATLLSPMAELIRRYPELASLVQKYRPATAPAEAA